MRKLFVLMALVTTLNGQSVVKVLPAPRRSGGLTFDGEHLWSGLYASGNDIFIFEVDTATGALVDTIPAPRDDCYGLAYDGQNLYYLHHYMGNDHHIYKLDLQGNVIDSFLTPKHYMAGLTFDGHHLWAGVYYDPDGAIYQLDPDSGNLIRSFTAPNTQPWGLAFDGSSLWMVDYYADTIYQIDTVSGQVLSSFPSPGSHPTGAAWDGQYLWVTARNPNSPTGWSFFKISPGGNGTPDINVPDTVVDFGSVPAGDTATQYLRIENTGDGELSIDSISISSEAFGPDTSLPLTVQPFSSVMLPIWFCSPERGSFQASMLIHSNDPDEPVVVVHLAAVATISGPEISVNDTSPDFGENYLGGLKRTQLVIINTGSDTLRVDSIAISGVEFSMETATIPFDLPPAAEETLTIYFSPNQIGYVEDTMWIYSNDPVTPVMEVFLSGTGISNLFDGGTLLWSLSGPDNVVSSTFIVDPYSGSVVVIFDSYDAGVTGPNLYAVRGESYGEGITLWERDLGGGWGEGGLMGVSDLNGDGYPDLIHGSAWGDRSVYAISGRDGNVIWRYDTKNEDGHGGWIYSVDTLGDVNGDGVVEVLAGAGGWNSGTMGPRCVYVFDGATGTVLFRHQANDAVISVSPIPDVNGDSCNDIIAGAGGNGTRDHNVYLVSGNPSENGRVLWSYDTGNDIWWVSNIDDLDGDGVQDVIVGNWGGEVIALSGSDGQLLWRSVVSNVVMKVVPIGDVNDDDLPDIAVGSWSPQVTVVSGADGSIIWTYRAGDDVWTVDSVPDLNGDGCNEVVAGSFDHNLYLIDGRTGQPLWTFRGDNKFFTVTSFPDVNHDGYADIGGGTQLLGSNGGTFYFISGGSVQPSIEETESISPSGVIFPEISATGWFSVKLSRPAEITVFDPSGRVILSRNVRNQGTWRFHIRRQGVYFVRVKTGKSMLSKKILVVNP